MRIIPVAIGVTFAFVFAWGITHSYVANEYGWRTRSPKNRSGVYCLCVLLVFVLSVLWGLINAAPVYPGDESESTHQVATVHQPGMSLRERDELIKNTFLVLILPALIGVRVALGRKSKSESLDLEVKKIMSSWVRNHKNAEIRTMVIEQQNGNYLITMVEPDQKEQHAAYNYSSKDEDDAKNEADTLVQTHYPTARRRNAMIGGSELFLRLNALHPKTRQHRITHLLAIFRALTHSRAGTYSSPLILHPFFNPSIDRSEMSQQSRRYGRSLPLPVLIVIPRMD